MPTTFPRASTSAPPELPGCTGRLTWKYRGSRRLGDANGWRVRVARAGVRDEEVCHHAAGDLRQRRGIGAAAAHNVDRRRGDVARTAAGHGGAHDKPIHHFRVGKGLGRRRIERQPVSARARRARDHLREDAIRGRQADRLVDPKPRERPLQLITAAHGQIGKGQERHGRDAQNRIENIRRLDDHLRRVQQACASEQTHFGRTLDDVIIGNQITIVRDEKARGSE